VTPLPTPGRSGRGSVSEADDALQWLAEQFVWERTLSALHGVDLDLTDWATGRPRRGRRMSDDGIVNVRYLVDDVDEAIDFYTEILGFELLTIAVPAFADVKRGNLRLLLAGPTCSARLPMPDGAVPHPGGWNHLHFVVDDISAEVARLRTCSVGFDDDIVRSPGGEQLLLHDPSGNIIELFQPAGC
jgi:catechol 2,3-dioxygenase-like lactoylglutathione lyase family enzyme